MSKKTNDARTTNGKKRSGFAAVFRKELARFFTDKRSVITTVLLPGLMIYVIYSFLGVGLSSMFAPDPNYVPDVAVLNAPESAYALAESAGFTLRSVENDEISSTKEAISAQEIDLLIIYSTDFDKQLTSRIDGGAEARSNTNEVPPSVELFYNSARTESSSAYNLYSSMLENYRDAQFTLFSINVAAPGTVYDLATDEDLSGFMMASLLPMLLMVFLFSGCMGVAPESIAGEKERGTIATMLVTPLKRHELALGKILALSCIALLAAASSFIGVMLSLPNMMAQASELANISLYSVSDYLLLLAVIFSTVLLFVGVLSVLSAFAKSVKEAATLAMPLMIIVMVVAVFASFSGQSNTMFYLVPVFNSAQCMAGIFSFSVEPLFIVETVIVNLLCAGVCVFVLTRMFNSERIIFTK